MRSTFAHPPLVRLLGAWQPADAQASGMDAAERLSLWVNAFDAIELQAAQQAIRAIAQPAAGKPRSATELAEDLQRVRSVLAAAIGRGPVEGEDYAPYRERQLALQGQMELMIPPLRAHVREVLGRASARLRQLAALDATMAQVLARREQAALPAVATLLKRRFEALRRAAEPDWAETFAREWRQALLAELDLRLAPVTGLVEALRNEPPVSR